ncbi:hypothetical protein JY651_22540 [Pyxidicoccus parkwayensis]|uniref:Uncharacterized protein n=1 Tax=Pyxidicoccus parkwayensis TaxID=2813578 RepID=A0ABX7PAL9_9BACT|nr:hypothetical protein [Pyxidicoccus parkwaysis]QSQ27520.1 hypothetical protein JY651_22540 [Pyxidicoccus parkwaysis]
MRARERTTLQVEPFLDFSEVLKGREARNWSIGPANDLWLLTSGEVLHFDGTGALAARLRISEPGRQSHYVQPLPGGEVALVEGRCRFIAKDQHERNAAVYTREGARVREFTLGDGIEDVQATSDGRLWVSYFDEGVMGNRGWGRGDADTTPIGVSGLVLFDSQGKCLSDYDAEAAGTDIIVDCYALNVASDDETWLYFYSEFPLVRLRSGEPATVWKTPLRGATAFAVNDTHVLFNGTYESHEYFQLFSLYDRGARRLKPQGTFRFEDGAGTPWRPTRACGRGSWLYGVDGTRVFRIDLDTVLAAANAWS